MTPTEWAEAVSGAQILAWVLAGIAVLTFAYKAWPWVRRTVRTVDALSDLPDFMERIRHQVENDHSTNLRDEVTQILDLATDTATQVAELSDWQKKHELKSDAVVARVAALESKEA